MIILNERIRLLEEGIIRSTGRMLEFEDESGEIHEYEEPEEIHSFAYWKEHEHRVVRKGSKAIAAFPIWVPKKIKKWEVEELKEDTSDASTGEVEISVMKKKMYLKQTFFFTYEQTEAIKKENKNGLVK